MQIQRVDHESRVHIDIETDDIPAEVTRLGNLARIIHERLEGCGFGTPVTVAPAARVVGA